MNSLYNAFLSGPRKKLLAAAVFSCLLGTVASPIIFAANLAPKDADVVAGKNANVDNYDKQHGSVAIGENAQVENMMGSQEKAFKFGVSDMSKWAGSVAIGENTYARSGSTMIGVHNYSGALGDITVDSSNVKSNNINVDATTIGTNSYNQGAFSTVNGAYSIISGKYDGSFWTSYYGGQNFGANIVGSLNSIESASSSNAYSGIANSIVGVANRTNNANGALIFGAGNQVTNSIRTISGVTSLGDTVTGAAAKLRTAVQNSNSGGATMVFGGGNTADYTLQSQIIGINSILTGTKDSESTNNFLDGVGNTGTNIHNTTIIGTANTAMNSSNNVVLGDNHYIDSKSNNVIIGSSDTANTKTNAAGAVILGHNANASVDGGVALGEGSQATVNAGQTGYDPGTVSTKTGSTWTSTAAAVSVGDAANDITRQITSVAAGTNDTDAVNVAQLKAATTEVVGSKGVKVTKTSGANGQAVYTVEGAYTAGSNITIDENGKISANVHDTTYSAGNGITIDSQNNNAISVKAADQSGLSVGTDGVAVNAGQGIEIKNNQVTAKIDGTNLQLSDKGIGLNNNLDLSTAGSVTIGNTSVNSNGITINNGPSLTSSGINAGGNTISDVAAGDISSTSTDAVNGSQLYQVSQDVTNVNNRVTSLGNKVDNLDNRIDKVGAASAALAGLHPLDFDLGDKWDFAAAYGHYEGAGSAAIGAFYRPNEDTMVSFGASLGNGETLWNAGLSFKLGQGNQVSDSKIVMTKKMQDMQSSMKAMDARIRALEAQNKDMAMMLEVYAKAIQQYNPNWHAHT